MTWRSRSTALARRVFPNECSKASEVPKINYISGLVFVVLLILGGLLALAAAYASPVFAVVLLIVWLPADVVASSSIRLAAQWERAVVFRLGKYHSTRGPGLFFI